VPDATDPFAEQHLEVEGFSWQTSPPPTGNGKRGSVLSGRDLTARRHQAVVTPYGCERGELFEG
jgi:hypothetical protein